MVNHLVAGQSFSDEGEVERRTRELQTLHTLAQAIAESLEPNEVLEKALQTLIDTDWFSCGEAYLSLDKRLVTVAVGSCPYDDIEQCPFRPKMTLEAERALEVATVTRVGNWQLVPVDREAVLAVTGGDVSEPFLEAVTDMVRASLKRARLHHRLAEKERQRSQLLQALLRAQEEERGRISRDLHDQVGQALTGMLLGLDAAKRDPGAAELDKLKELASVTLTDVRRIALDLRPSVLDELGLEAALKRYAREVAERFGLAVSVLVSLPCRPSHDEETVLYRVSQEAVTNIVRHAKAQQASVVITSSPTSIQLVVEDNGVGFDPRTLLLGEQIGLAGMRERVEILGGNFRVESTMGQGTTVYARLPWRGA